MAQPIHVIRMVRPLVVGRRTRGTGGCSETIPKIGLDEAASLRIAAGSSRAVAWRLPCGAERPRP